MYLITINVILAAVPSFLLVLYFYRRDKYKKESPRSIIKAFLYGFLGLIPALAIEYFAGGIIIASNRTLNTLFHAFIVSGFTEEAIKLLIVMLFFYPKAFFDEVTDGIVFAAVVSLGFAFFENIFYSAGSSWVILLRGITAVPLHAAASGIMGYFIGRSKQTGRNTLGSGLLLATAVHGLYNFFLFTGGWISFAIIPLLLIIALLLRRLLKAALAADASAGRRR